MMGVQLDERFGDRRGRIRTLNRDFAGVKRHAGPATLGVLDHIALGGRSSSTDQPDASRQKRERTLSVKIEQALSSERDFESLEPSQQFTKANVPEVGGGQ